jgi:hypothetical protein
LAAPVSSAVRALAMPSWMSRATLAAYSAAPAFSTTMSRAAPGWLSSTCRISASDSCGVSTLKARLLAMGRPKSSGWISYSRDLAVLQLAHHGGGAQAHFVHAVAAVDHQRVLGAQPLQRAHLDADQVGVEHAHQDVGRAGRIGQRARGC